MRFYSLLVLAAVGSRWLGVAWADENPQACAKAYEKAQEEKTAGRFNSAIAHLKTCLAAECPSFIREDCLRWMDQTELALPTVVFSVREDGNDLTDVEILCDNKPLTGKLDGKALPLDPGLHDFSFRLPGHTPIARQVLVREGERNRIIIAEFHKLHKRLSLPEVLSPIGETTLEAKPNPHSGRILPYALAGAGVLGLAGFTTFAILGNSQQGELERTCAPNCQSGQIDSVKLKYHLADASLGVGLVSLGVA
ncbi:MAG TPA: hypothetical protein VIM14_15370, partial [Polyangia bacterium]